MEAEELKEKTQDTGSHIEEYANTLYRLAMITITQKASNIASGVIVAVAVCLFGLFMLFFASFGLAWWLGDVVQSRVTGFLIIAGFYFLLIVVLIFSRKKILFPFFRNWIVRKIYE